MTIQDAKVGAKSAIYSNPKIIQLHERILHNDA